MIVTAHQPAYLPWLGYIHKIAVSDIFVLLDEVQFEKNSFTNRNKVWSPNGPVMLTVPLLTKGHIDKPMRAIEINNGENWRAKHLRTLEQSYRKAPHFERYAAWLAATYSRTWFTLAELTAFMLSFFLAELRVSTKIVRQSELVVDGRKQDLVLALCNATGADVYVSGILGKDYLDTAPFESAGVTVYFQNYVHPVYPQIGKGDFIPYLGIIDLLMNVDADEALETVFAHNDGKSALSPKKEFLQ